MLPIPKTFRETRQTHGTTLGVGHRAWQGVGPPYPSILQQGIHAGEAMKLQVLALLLAMPRRHRAQHLPNCSGHCGGFCGRELRRAQAVQ